MENTQETLKNLNIRIAELKDREQQTQKRLAGANDLERKHRKAEIEVIQKEIQQHEMLLRHLSQRAG
jgi:hypothetical protein